MWASKAKMELGSCEVSKQFCKVSNGYESKPWYPSEPQIAGIYGCSSPQIYSSKIGFDTSPNGFVSSEMNLSSQPPQYTPSRSPLNPQFLLRKNPHWPIVLHGSFLRAPNKWPNTWPWHDMKQFGSQEGGRRKWWSNHVRWHINWTYIISYITVYTFQETYIDRDIEDSLIYIYILYYIYILCICICMCVYIYIVCFLYIILYIYICVCITIYQLKTAILEASNLWRNHLLTACDTRCVDAAESSPLRRREVAAGDTALGDRLGPPNGKNSRCSPGKIGDSIINHG